MAVGGRQTSAGRFKRLARRGLPSSLPVFVFCLLPLTFYLTYAFRLPPSAFFGGAEPWAPARMSEGEADEVLLRAARAALGGREGAVVVMDAQTGRVRALAGGRTAFEEATPPGSVVKPFTMLAALGAGSLSEDRRLHCRGTYRHEDFKIDCSHPRYASAFGPAQALANSCNYYFARTAETLDASAYSRTLGDFGFGTPTGGGDEREAPGLLPRDAPGVAEMLGESEQLRVTPAQLASGYAALFNGGLLLAPRHARAEGFTPTVRARLDVSDGRRALLLAGMRGAVAYGTASVAGLSTLPVYVFGKTGTATPQEGWRAQGWFVGFAAGGAESDAESGEGANGSGGDFSTRDAADFPAESVRLAVVVFLKRSRGAEAARLARPVFEAYARTLGRGGDERRLAARSGESLQGDDGRGASPLSPGSGAEGRAVRVRLTRGDATATLALEDYVFGVLAAEGSVESEPEALKALAVVARTYAVGNPRRHARDRFDLCDTTHCQRFAAVGDESARPDFYEMARRAVRETAGEVLRDPAGRVAESYFSASCGGATADVAKLWGATRPASHLRGVRDDACAGASERWTDVIPAARLSRALGADERSDVGGVLEGVRVVRRDRTGRAELVEVVGARRRLLRGWDFKIIVGRTLGWGVLKSSRFEVSRAGSAFVFRGTGFGHGLGLCQAGAHVSAARGASYRQILGRYFPGAAVGVPRDGGLGAKVDESGAVENHLPHEPPHAPVEVEGEVEVGAGSEVKSDVAAESEGESGVKGRVFQTAYARRAAFSRDASSPVALSPAAFSQAAFVPAVFRRAGYDVRRAAVGQLRSEHFRLSYPARVARGEAESLLRTLEAAYADVSRRLGRAGVGVAVPDVEVTAYETTGDFVGATGRPAWVAAVTEGRRIRLQPLEVLRRRGVLGTAPRHEVAHAALEAVGAGRAPLWLVEGLAAHFAGEGPALGRAAPGERISTEELERRLARPASAQEMRALYAAAYREVASLIRREGEPAVWRRALR